MYSDLGSFNSPLRLFVALELKDDQVRQRIGQVQQELSNSGAHLKPVNPSILHMTLKFIGEVPDQSVESISRSLAQLRVPRFTLHHVGVGVFPSMRRMNVIWVGCREGSDSAVRLQQEVDRVLSKWGREERGFKPHITIFRVKGGSAGSLAKLGSLVQKHMNDDFGEAEYTMFQLKKSTLFPSGPVYEDLETYQLV